MIWLAMAFAHEPPDVQGAVPRGEWPEGVPAGPNVYCQGTMMLSEVGEVVEATVRPGCPEAFVESAHRALMSARWTIQPSLPAGRRLEVRSDVVFVAPAAKTEVLVMPMPAPALELVRPIPCTVEVSGRAGFVHTSQSDCPIVPARLPDWPDVPGACELSVEILPWGGLGEVTADAKCPDAVREYGETWLKASRFTTEGRPDRINVRITRD